jgi:hypothetical protein
MQITPIGQPFDLMGQLFECVGHTTDRSGKPAEIPGKHLGPTPKGWKAATTPGTASQATIAFKAPKTPTAQHKPAVRRQRGDFRPRKYTDPPKERVVVQQAANPLGAIGLVLAIAALFAAFACYNHEAANAKLLDFGKAAYDANHRTNPGTRSTSMGPVAGQHGKANRLLRRAE